VSLASSAHWINRDDSRKESPVVVKRSRDWLRLTLVLDSATRIVYVCSRLVCFFTPKDCTAHIASAAYYYRMGKIFYPMCLSIACVRRCGEANYVLIDDSRGRVARFLFRYNIRWLVVLVGQFQRLLRPYLKVLCDFRCELTAGSVVRLCEIFVIDKY